MIPEKGKKYYLNYTPAGLPEWSHYVGIGECLDGTGDDTYTSEVWLYEFKLDSIDGEGGHFFEEKYIINEIASPVDEVQTAYVKIKQLQALLYETLEHIRSGVVARHALEGPHERLDREADELIAEINKQFTTEELEEANITLMEKYK
jgi:hypothetical protein